MTQDPCPFYVFKQMKNANYRYGMKCDNFFVQIGTFELISLFMNIYLYK